MEEPSMVRRASHAGSWYSDDSERLSRELQSWLVQSSVQGQPTARAVIAPHAGYSYSGKCAAFAFGQIDPNSVKRIFILGPSHHHFTRRCALSSAKAYRTPLGDIPIDEEVYSLLRATGKFEEMSMEVDESEHSMEMHLPYLVKVMAGKPFTLVPILVGALQAQAEAAFGRLLAPFLTNKENFFSVSSDFCHWGTRFNYTHYEREQGPIFKSIEVLDRRGMELVEAVDPEGFRRYLVDSGNTICGRHPIAVLLHMLKLSDADISLRFVRYEQSHQCTSLRQSSVSYASAVALEEAD